MEKIKNGIKDSLENIIKDVTLGMLKLQWLKLQWLKRKRSDGHRCERCAGWDAAHTWWALYIAVSLKKGNTG